MRYVPAEHHEIVAPEFLEELRTRGRIYGYRYRRLRRRPHALGIGLRLLLGEQIGQAGG